MAFGMFAPGMTSLANLNLSRLVNLGDDSCVA